MLTLFKDRWVYVTVILESRGNLISLKKKKKKKGGNFCQEDATSAIVVSVYLTGHIAKKKNMLTPDCMELA